MPDTSLTWALEPDVAAELITAQSAEARAALVASTIAGAIPDSGCILYRFNSESEDEAWSALALAGDLSLVRNALPREHVLFAPLIGVDSTPVIWSAADLDHEHTAHLQLPRPVVSLACLPMLQADRLVGAACLLSFSDPLSAEDVDGLQAVLSVGAHAITAAEQTEQQRRDLMDSVQRLTQLYDLEKSLNATLELSRLTPLIPRKVFSMLRCQAVHLWLFDSDKITLTATAGNDPTVYAGMVQLPGQGYVADMAEEGTPLCLTDPEDPRLRERSGGSDTPVWTAMLVPLMDEEAEVGVLEAINKIGGEPFDEDDEFFFGSIAETVGSALKNASLMFAERKLAILEALVHVSSEITSTLRLERLLQIIVNSPQSVLPYERCSIALDNRGKLQIKAISGMPRIAMGDAQVDALLNLCAWLGTLDGAAHLRQRDEDPGDLPEPVVKHFAATSFGALYALPLHDDQGRVGVLIYEATDPDFLDVPHIEMIKILAGQATVAIRNALLYREVPLISLLEPLMQHKQALLRTKRGRRITLGVSAVLLVLFLIFCPLPLRVACPATVAAEHLITVAAPVDGIIASVSAHEGQRVQRGQVLASMRDLQWRMDLASAQARYQAAMLTMESDLARGLPQAGADRAQVEYLKSEVDRAQARIESAELRSPIDGVVMTPLLENAAGEHLNAGDTFAQVLDLSSAVVDLAVPQSNAELAAPGQSAAIKLDSYPQRTWHGRVTLLSPQAVTDGTSRVFIARVSLTNQDAILRAGMTGRGKIFIGYRPAGYVLLRRPALWLWQTAWDWFGW